MLVLHDTNDYAEILAKKVVLVPPDPGIGPTRFCTVEDCTVACGSSGVLQSADRYFFVCFCEPRSTINSATRTANNREGEFDIFFQAGHHPSTQI